MNKTRLKTLLFLSIILGLCLTGTAQEIIANPDEVNIKIGLEGGNFTKAVNILLMMTLLSLMPSFIIMMTSFTRIVIVLSFLKQALGTQQTPPMKVINGLALILTIFIMQPVFDQVYKEAVVPYGEKQITEKQAIEKGMAPIRDFMLRQTREEDLVTFMDMAKHPDVESAEELPFRIVLAAFIVSELKTAFQMGFLIFLPFLVIDILIATILMSMGMMMLPPAMIALPFKILLFILVDGWGLIVNGLVASFG